MDRSAKPTGGKNAPSTMRTRPSAGERATRIADAPPATRPDMSHCVVYASPASATRDSLFRVWELTS